MLCGRCRAIRRCAPLCHATASTCSKMLVGAARLLQMLCRCCWCCALCDTTTLHAACCLTGGSSRMTLHKQHSRRLGRFARMLCMPPQANRRHCPGPRPATPPNLPLGCPHTHPAALQSDVPAMAQILMRGADIEFGADLVRRQKPETYTCVGPLPSAGQLQYAAGWAAGPPCVQPHLRGMLGAACAMYAVLHKAGQPVMCSPLLRSAACQPCRAFRPSPWRSARLQLARATGAHTCFSSSTLQNGC